MLTDTSFDDVGLLCLIIDGGRGNQVRGRIRLQKTAYFCRYLGWNIGDYRMHNYGPFSYLLMEAVGEALSAKLINESDRAPHRYSLTDRGRQVLATFEDKVCGKETAGKTRALVKRLAGWSSVDLELAATLDFVSKTYPHTKKDLLQKVGYIKRSYDATRIRRAHEKWQGLLRTDLIVKASPQLGTSRS